MMLRCCPVCSVELAEDAEICTNCGNEEFQNEEVITKKREVWQEIEAKRQRIRELREKRELIDENRDYTVKKEQLPALEKRISGLEEELQELEKKNRQLNEELEGLDSRGLPENTAGLKLDGSPGKKSGDLPGEYFDKSPAEIETDNSPSSGSSQGYEPDALSELELRQKINQLQEEVIEELRWARRAQRRSQQKMENKVKEAEEKFTEKKNRPEAEKNKLEKKKTTVSLDSYDIPEKKYQKLREKVMESSLTEIEDRLAAVEDEIENKLKKLKKKKAGDHISDAMGTGVVGGLILFVILNIIAFINDELFILRVLLFIPASFIGGMMVAAVTRFIKPLNYYYMKRRWKIRKLSRELKERRVEKRLLKGKRNKEKVDILDEKLNKYKTEFDKQCKAAENEYANKLEEIKQKLSTGLEKLAGSIAKLKKHFSYSALPWADKAWGEWSTPGYIPAAVRLGDTELNLRELDVAVKKEEDVVPFSDMLSSLEGTLEESLILVTEMEIYDIESILPLIEKVAQHGKTLLIITPEAGKEVIEILAVNRVRGVFTSSIITIPDNKTLSKVARETGAEVLGGDDLNSLQVHGGWSDICRVLGTAVSVKVAGNQVVISGGGEGSGSEVENKNKQEKNNKWEGETLVKDGKKYRL